MNDDIKHLNLLALFHYILGGITALFACFPLIHIVIGRALISGKVEAASRPGVPSSLVGYIFIIVATICIIVCLCMAVCMILAASRLKQHKNRIFCMVVAGIECTFMPFGTVLGVFTLIMLSKDSVKNLFNP